MKRGKDENNRIGVNKDFFLCIWHQPVWQNLLETTQTESLCFQVIVKEKKNRATRVAKVREKEIVKFKRDLNLRQFLLLGPKVC